MRHRIRLLFIIALFLTGCERERAIEDSPSQMNKGSNNDTTYEMEENIDLDLNDAAFALIKSTSDSAGVLVTESQDVKGITDNLLTCKPYDPADDYASKYEYTITFYDDENMELVTIQAYDDFVIAYEGNLYYDDSKQFYMSSIRDLYIKKTKESFTCDATSIRINGAKYDLHDIDSGINAIEKYAWFGSDDFPDPSVILVCHISPNVGYCAVFDVEKMEYVFGTYGAPFIWDNYIESLVYAFEDTVYNYWGDSIYQNNDSSYYIYDLDYEDETILITLASRQTEERIEVVRINYHKSIDNDERLNLGSSESLLLSEFHADLLHNGSQNKLSIFEAETAGELASLEMADANGNIMWLEQANSSHAGWNSVYLCNIKGEDYILVFNPYENCNIADFTYVLFYLNGTDTITMVDSGRYSFYYGAEKGADDAFKKESFLEFAEKVNIYLQNSYLLMSTENGNLNIVQKKIIFQHQMNMRSRSGWQK